MIFDDNICTLGEGPLWHPKRNQLFWFDILNRRLHTSGRYWEFGSYVSAAGWIDADTLLIASAEALSRFDLETGKIDPLVALEADNPITRSNDGRADPQGGFWIGTMGINAEPEAGAIYRFYKGELRLLYPDIQVSNSICFHPDGRSACYTDTDTQKIMKVALDRDGWPTGEPEIHIDLRGTEFRPDGAVFDADGNLWNAQWGAGRVAGYDPDGREFASFYFPATQTSCPAFGGPDGSTMFVTSAAVDLTDPSPEDGKTFAIDTPHKGQAEHRVIL